MCPRGDGSHKIDISVLGVDALATLAVIVSTDGGVLVKTAKRVACVII
jgi:hypothetical protein